MVELFSSSSSLRSDGHYQFIKLQTSVPKPLRARPLQFVLSYKLRVDSLIYIPNYCSSVTLATSKLSQSYRTRKYHVNDLPEGRDRSPSQRRILFFQWLSLCLILLRPTLSSPGMSSTERGLQGANTGYKSPQGPFVSSYLNVDQNTLWMWKTRY